MNVGVVVMSAIALAAGGASIAFFGIPASDLDAQRSMSVAAWAATLLNFLSLAVGVVTLLFLRANLIEAQKVTSAATASANAAEAAVVAAEKATATSRELGMSQVRAYLSFTTATFRGRPTRSGRVGGGTASDDVWDASSDVDYALINTGQSPALRVEIEGDLTTAYFNAFDDADTGKTPPVRTKSVRFIGDVPAGQAVAVAAHFRNNDGLWTFRPLWEEVTTAEGGFQFHLSGKISYDDVFGRRIEERFSFNGDCPGDRLTEDRTAYPTYEV